MKAIPKDYDTDPERFRTNVQNVEKYSLEGDVHESVAQRLVTEEVSTVLDVGCGEGRFTKPARELGLKTIAFDFSTTMLTAVSNPRTQGDACHLPFAVGSFDAVVALYMLYHLHNPRDVLVESVRVLHSGGLFMTCAPSRFNDPELRHILPQSPRTFDAENGLEMIKDYFQEVEVERWDALLVHLPDKKAVAQYLRGRQLKSDKIKGTVATIKTPLTLTKRGALFIGRKRP